MARMSIDDKFLRDPRVKAMAAQLGVHPRLMRGWLLEVFAVCYDLETDVLTPALIDQSADHPGFSDALFAHDLATTTRHGLRIRGAGKRIKYLAEKANAGRVGGVKSGESRRNSAKQKSNEPRSKREPSSSSSSSSSGSDLSPSARAIPCNPVDGGEPSSRHPGPRATQQVAATTGQGTSDQAAQGRADLDLAAGNVAEPQLGPTPDRVEPPPSTGTFNLADPRSIGRLAEVTYRRVSDARIAVAAELKLPAPLAFPEPAPNRQTRGLVELRARIGEEGDRAELVCDRVVSNLVAQAREDKSIEWLAEKAFGDKAWPHARDWIPRAKRTKPIASAHYGKPERSTAPAPTRGETKPLLLVSKAELAESARIAAAANTLPNYGVTDGARAPPASATTSTEETHEPRKAQTT